MTFYKKDTTKGSLLIAFLLIASVISIILAIAKSPIFFVIVLILIVSIIILIRTVFLDNVKFIVDEYEISEFENNKKVASNRWSQGYEVKYKFDSKDYCVIEFDNKEYGFEWSMKTINKLKIFCNMKKLLKEKGLE